MKIRKLLFAAGLFWFAVTNVCHPISERRIHNSNEEGLSPDASSLNDHQILIKPSMLLVNASTSKQHTKTLPNYPVRFNGMATKNQPWSNEKVVMKDALQPLNKPLGYVMYDPLPSFEKSMKPSYQKRKEWNYKIFIELQHTSKHIRKKLDILETALRDIADFFGDSAITLVFPIWHKLEGDTLKLVWSNITMGYPLCSEKLMHYMSTNIFDIDASPTADFKRAFEPELRLVSAHEERRGFCSDYSLNNTYARLIENIILPQHSTPTKANRPRFRRNAAVGNPPIVNQSLPSFNASYCSLFVYAIPEKVFLDKEEGNTRNLTLTILHMNGTSVSLNSWLQLDGSLQTLYGYLKVSDSVFADSEKFFHYKVRATDSTGLSADAPFSIKIPHSPPTVFFKVVLTVNSFEEQGKPYVNEVIFLAYKVIRFFNDNYFTTVNVLDFNRNHTSSHAEETVTFGWTNCTISGPGCPSGVIESLTRKLITDDGKPNPSFTEKLKPQYSLYDLKIEKVGACLAPLSSVISLATPTPVHSLSPIISNAIPEIVVYTTQPLNYQIPTNTFYDVLDGSTRNLRLQLRTAANISLSASSWIQFHVNTQIIFGILTTNVFTSANPMSFTYLLIATNSRGYSTYLTISLKGYRETISFGALFSISGRDNSQSTVNDITILDTTLNKLRGYVKDKKNDTIEVKSFTRLSTGQQKIFSFVYTNTSITTSNCVGLQRIIPLLQTEGSLINQDLTAALVPEIVADRIDIVRYGSCSNLQSRSIGPSPTPGGLFPVTINQVPLINIKTGLYFSFRIPVQTFYDASDGDTTKLRLQVTFSNGNALIHGSWVQFDTVSQTLYGLLPANQQSVRPYQNFTLILRATNSLGYSTVQIITIQSQYQSIGNGIVVTFSGREYNINHWNDVQLQNFMLHQLRGYFKITSNDTIKIISFQHHANGGSQFITLWTDTRLVANDCDISLLRNLESKMFSANNTVHPNLITKLLPNIVLIDAKISYYGQCIRNITTSAMIFPTPTDSNAPQYSIRLPIVNVTTGLPFSYKIPRDTFIDKIDGDTHALLLSVSESDGSPITYASPAQFNTSHQIVAGIFFESVLQGSFFKDFHYTLTATNSRNLKTSIPLTIRAEANQNRPGTIVTTSANTFYNQMTPHLKISSDFLRLISNYIIPSDTTDFSIISLQHTTSNIGQTTIAWSYNKINGTACNRTMLKSFLSLLNVPNSQPNPNFIAAMSPTFIVFASTSEKVNSCDNSTYFISSTITPVFHITPSSSFPLPISLYISSIINTNTPPKVTSQILPLFAYFCSRFSYTIPNDLFRDDEDGDTRSLKIRLQTHERITIGASSWLQYSDTSKVLYGILKISDFFKKPSGGYRFYLVATDKQGLEVSTDFTITIPDIPLRYNHVITMRVNRIFDNSIPDVNEQLLISTKILEFFKDSNTNSINIISYQRSQAGNSATIEWSNCSIAYSPCPIAGLSAMLSKVIDTSGTVTDNFKSAMLPHYTIQQFNVRRLPPCNTTEQSSTVSTMTISPSPSLPPFLPPLLQEPLNQLNISWCAPLQLQIPEKMFSDGYGGTSKNMSIDLLQINGSSLPSQYWLRFDTKTQTIIAYPTLNDLSSYETTYFLVTATNQRKLTAKANITFVVTKPKPNPNHQIKVTAAAYVSETVTNVDIRILIWNKMKKYFQSNSTEIISFTNYSRSISMPSRVIFTFSFCFVSEDPCQKSELDDLLLKLLIAPGIINSEFVVAFSPEIVLTDVSVEHVGICTSYTLTPSLTQATTYIPVTSSVHVVPKNQPPLILQNIGTLNIDACNVFVYVVPERAFYDVEDGLTQHLRLSVTHFNGTRLSNDSWVTFDQRTRVLKAVYTKDGAQDFQFILKATDKGGLTASQTLHFKVQRLVNPVMFSVDTLGTDYSSKGTPIVEILEQFSRKLVSYIGVPVQLLSQSRTGNQSLKISWTICDQSDWCNDTAFTLLKNKLLITETVLNPDLVIALGPAFIVRQINIQSIVSCSSLAKAMSTAASIIPPSQAFTSLLFSSTVSTLNTAPMFVKRLPTLMISSCRPFSMKLPDALCFDREDGFNNVILSVAYKNGTQLSESSLLNFNRANRTIYGVLKLSDLTPNGQLKEEFSIYCQDSKNLVTSKELAFNATESSKNQTGYSLTFHTYIYTLSAQRNVDIQMVWIQKFQKYMAHPDASLVQFLKFDRLSSIQATFTISLCNVDICNSSLMLFIRDKIFSTMPDLKPQFVAAMIPEFSLVSSTLIPPSSIDCPIQSTIVPTQTSFYSQLASSVVFKNPIKVLKSILAINISLCSQFVYEIPEDVFYDPVEGYTRNLTVSIHDDNSSLVNQNAWLSYDHTKLMITGYAVQDEVLQDSSKLRFRLIARNSRGSSAEALVLLNLSPPYNAVYSGFVTEADVYGTYKDNVQLMLEISTKIKAYIGKPSESGLVFTKYTKYGTNRPRIEFTWSTCSLIDSCDQSTFKAISSKLLFSGTILNFEFITALAPNILVTQARILNNGGCTDIRTPQTTYGTTYTQILTQSDLPTTLIIRPTAFVQASYLTNTINTELLRPSGASTASLATSSIPSVLKVQTPLAPLTLNICSPISFQIPENTFYDSYDGSTRNLTLTALLQDHSTIPLNYWAKFVSDSQTLIAHATQALLKDQPVNGYQFIIRATNRRNQYAETPLVLKISSEAPPALHNITVSFEETSPMAATFVDAITFIRSRLSLYFGDATNNSIAILQSRQSNTSPKVVNVTWYNCTLASLGCNTNIFDAYFSRIVTANDIVNPSFTVAFRPYFQVQSVSKAMSVLCFTSMSPLLSLQSLPILDSSTYSVPVVQTTDFAKSATFISMVSSSVIWSRNSPPTPMRSLNISVSYCDGLRYKIPNDVFHDKEDGGADKLTLELLSIERNPLNCNDTVQLNQTSQEIFGTIVATHWNTTQILLLRATDKSGLSATTNVVFTTSKRPSRQGDHVSVMWTDCSAFDKVCNDSLAQDIKQKIITNSTIKPELNNFLLPNIRLESVTISETEICKTPSSSAIVLNITLCNKLNYTLNESLYRSSVISLDQKQKRQELAFELVSSDGRQLNWIMLEKDNIVAMPVYNELKNKPNTVLQLNAIFDKQVIKSLDVVLQHSNIKAVQINFTISLTMISYKSIDMTDVRLLEAIKIPIADYLNSSSSEFVVVSYNRSRVYPETVKLIITPCSTLRICNSTHQQFVTNALALGNGVPTYGLVRAMLPDLFLLGLVVNNTSQCKYKKPEENSTNIEIVVPLCTRLFAKTTSGIIKSAMNFSEKAQYKLLDSSGNALSLNSWVQLEENENLIYGVPTQMLLKTQPAEGYTFILRAKDDKGRIKDAKLNITITGNRAKPNYTQTIFFKSQYLKNTSDAKILLTVRDKLSLLLQNISFFQITFISFRKQFDASQMSMLEFTNCSFLSDPSECSNQTIDMMSKTLIGRNGQPTQALETAMQPNNTIFKIIETRSYPCRNISNHPPTSDKPFPLLNVSVCARLELSIPDATFIDPEDGNASSLVLFLKSSDGKYLQLDSWIQLDLLMKTIYGIPTYDVISKRPSNGYIFRLEAQDSNGAVASLPITVNMSGNTPNRSLVNLLVETPLLDSATSIVIQRAFLINSAKCLNISQQDIALANYKVIERTTKQINISIFYNCTYSQDQCDKALTIEFLNRVSSNSTYRQCVYPEFSVIKVDMTLTESCKNTTANTAPSSKFSSLQLNITICEALYYKLPNNTFTDAEDGVEIMKSIKLVKANGSPIQKSDFVQLNKATNTIYALYPGIDDMKQNIFSNYSLEAVDSSGEKTRSTVAINVPERTQNFTYHICLVLRQYSQVPQMDIDVVIEILQRIERFLTNSSQSQFIVARNYSLTEIYPRSIKLCITNCSFSDGACHETSVKELRKVIFLRDNIATQQFRQALGPDFMITEVSDYYASHCQMAPLTYAIYPTVVSSLVLATSSIMPTPYHFCFSGKNSSPKIINSVGSLTVYIGRPLMYNIPNDIVYDKEDGYLKVKLTNMDNTAIEHKWLQFDETEQRIYVSVFETERSNFKSEQYFRLVATDSCGIKVYDILTVTVVGAVSCCYVIQLESTLNYLNWTGNVTTQYVFFKRLVNAFNDTQDQLRLYGIVNQTYNISKTAVLFTNSSYSNESCLLEHTGQLSDVVFLKNGTSRKSFVSQFADFGIVDAVAGNSSSCNKTFVPLIPITVNTPGAAKARTFDDWLWYVLPFIILAFLVICCCFLFYWCGACRQTCCGGAKKSGDLFSAAAAAKPIQEEIMMPVAADVAQAEDPSTAAVAANALSDNGSSKDPFEEMYADIDATARNSSVPSLYKTRSKPLWMKAAKRPQAGDPPSDSTGTKPIEEPILQSAASLPQEAPPDTTDGLAMPIAASLPRPSSPEQPMTATYSPNTRHRPSYLISPSSSVTSVEEDPQTAAAIAPMAQGPSYSERPLIHEDGLQAISNTGFEAAPAPVPNEPSINPVNENPIESGILPQFQQPLSAPLLRLPSTPIISPSEAPPPYSPPAMIKERGPRWFRTRPATRVIEKRPTKTIIHIPKRLSRLPKIRHTKDHFEERPYPRKSTQSVTSPLKYSVSLESRNGLKRRSISGSRKRQVIPIRTLRRESKRVEPDQSYERIKSFESLIPKSNLRPSFDYLSDYYTDVTSVGEHPPRMPRYGSKDFLHKDDSYNALSEDQVPVKINGVVKAPEKLLMKWLKDGSLQTTITNADPNFDDSFVLKNRPKKRTKSPLRGVHQITSRHEQRPSLFEQRGGDLDEVHSFTDLLPRRQSRRKGRQISRSQTGRHKHNAALSDIAESTGNVSERPLSIGYPYSKDLYEYVQTVVRPREVDKIRKDRPLTDSVDISFEDSRSANQIQKKVVAGSQNGLTRQKSRRSINEILSRMTRRRQLKKHRRAFQDNEFHEL
eukprot:gene15509-6772_t